MDAFPYLDGLAKLHKRPKYQSREEKEKFATLFFSFEKRKRNLKQLTRIKSQVFVCRTLLNSPLLRRKRGGGGDKSSLDSSEEEINICANSPTNSPAPRHRLLQVLANNFNWICSPFNFALFSLLRVNIQFASN